MKLMEMPLAKFDGEQMDNIFFVKNLNTSSTERVNFKDVFNWIKEQSIKNGLTVELKDDRIVFITHKV